jgi:hypothetical protein
MSAIDADIGTHVWAERYDRDLVDIFELQDEADAAHRRHSEPGRDGAAEQPSASPPTWVPTIAFYEPSSVTIVERATTTMAMQLLDQAIRSIRITPLPTAGAPARWQALVRGYIDSPMRWWIVFVRMPTAAWQSTTTTSNACASPASSGSKKRLTKRDAQRQAAPTNPSGRDCSRSSAKF